MKNIVTLIMEMIMNKILNMKIKIMSIHIQNLILRKEREALQYSLAKWSLEAKLRREN